MKATYFLLLLPLALKVFAQGSQYTPEQIERIERNRKIAAILADVDSQFRSRKTPPTTAEDLHSSVSFMRRAKKRYKQLQTKWGLFSLGGKRIESPLPKYLKELDGVMSVYSEDDSAVQGLEEQESEVFLAVAPSLELNGFSATSNYGPKDYEEKDCDKKMVREYVKRLCTKLDDVQRESLAGLVNVVDLINSGSIEAVNELVRCLGALEEDVFDIFKEILVIIDKLVEIGVDAVQLVVEAIIDLFGNVIKSWEEKECGCDCPGFLQSLLKYIIDVITWTPKKLLKQLIEHIIDVILSAPFPRCTCACEGIFATDVHLGASRNGVIHSKREESSYQMNDTIGNVTIAIQSRRKSRKDIRNQRVNSPLLGRFEQYLQERINRKDLNNEHQEDQDEPGVKPGRRKEPYEEEYDFRGSRGQAKSRGGYDKENEVDYSRGYDRPEQYDYPEEVGKKGRIGQSGREDGYTKGRKYREEDNFGSERGSPNGRTKSSAKSRGRGRSQTRSR